MKTKQWLSAFALAAMVMTTQVACDSKTENKAEEVQDAQEDLNEARAEGDTSDVREAQSDLDTARKEYIEEGTKENR